MHVILLFYVSQDNDIIYIEQISWNDPLIFICYHDVE